MDESLLEDLIESKEFKTVSKYRHILNLLLSKADDNGIARISQPEIATMMGLSQTAVANKFKFLRKYGLIEKVGEKNAYKVLSTNLLSKTPFGTMFAIVRLIEDNPEVFSSFAKQSEILGVSMNEIQVAWGFLSYYTGTKYK
ncbi:hypothetical protein BRE01_62810 [Brevibacillus reuszeri]|uniref:Uncharacterized protein n=1 Tax=Brevibacillus reuszeri TaxID=54915 RepID=A0A0K9YWG3_9BACL|nr:winged helix-turn-helix transcriptional regulator [Brevibacillus reuszeri]KNB72962.1 hypothetical protein ADS79_14165 [Brevibacillus reuszeri]GED72579.1 hypothetical protein BRE01_62810 [Brevibacillus reuszeri]